MQLDSFPHALVRLIEAGHLRPAGYQVDVLEGSASHDRFGGRLNRGIEQLLDPWLAIRLGQERIDEFASDVGVDEQDPLPAPLPDGREHPRRVRLANAALEVEYGEDAGGQVIVYGHVG